MTKTKLIFATDNQNKVDEINKLLPEDFKFEIVAKKQAGIYEEIMENGTTLEENAIIKANYISDNYGYNCFSEDTGLFVEVLSGEPGIYSARYSGEGHNDEKNIDLLLKNLEGKLNRNAYFKTVVALNLKGKQYIFEGIADGKIIEKKTGKSGFGYDPVFMPVGYKLTFAQLDKEAKNKISHRGKAVRKLIDFLTDYNFE